jgi:HEAT repeats
MEISSSIQAMEILDDVREDAAIREAAIRYLAEDPTPTVIARLVQTLQDDDFSVRWEAARVLALQGEAAVLEVLRALTDPERVGDPRLREGAFHILHNNTVSVPVPMAELLEALHEGPAADITSLVEADRVLRQFEKYRLAKAQTTGKPGAAGAAQPGIFSPQDGFAQLTGHLSRLNGHHVG